MFKCILNYFKRVDWVRLVAWAIFYPSLLSLFVYDPSSNEALGANIRILGCFILLVLDNFSRRLDNITIDVLEALEAIKKEKEK